MKNTKKIILVAIISIITLYQCLDTYSICRGQENIQMIYQVKQGENLITIADKFGTTTEKLQQLNSIGGLIVDPGTKLKVE